MQSYPNTRLRRNRKAQWIRDLVAENHLISSDLIVPLFITEGVSAVEEIKNMDSVYRYSIDKMLDEVKRLHDLGVQAVMLFPYIPQDLKTHDGAEALNKSGLMCRAVEALKKHLPQVGVIVDVALDPYTSHGHDGVLDDHGDVDNDKTVKLLCEQALMLAGSGADAVAPSDMMDGRIGCIRKVFEDNHYYNTQIFAYSVKYISNFYSPFRHAVGSISNLSGSDKKSYQMDYRNSREAILEIEMDIQEGADAIIIKPGMMCLDIVKTASQKYNLPVLSYHVSGEYSILRNAVRNSIIADEKQVVLEILHCFKRAGASAIITYYAGWIAGLLH